MLTKILSNFPEDELLSFLPKNSINFTLLDAKYNQVLESSFHNKNKLTGIASSVKHGDFTFDSQLRNKLIGSLSAAQLAELFSSFELEEKNVTPSYRPYSYQQSISKQLLSQLGQNKKGVLIHLPKML